MEKQDQDIEALWNDQFESFITSFCYGSNCGDEDPCGGSTGGMPNFP